MLHVPFIRVDIYEYEVDIRYPVVSHIFYGKTLKEAQGYFKAHMKTDEFLRGAVSKGSWKGLELHVEVTEHG